MYFLEYRIIYPLFALFPTKLAYKAATVKGMIEGVFCKKAVNSCVSGLEHCFNLNDSDYKSIAKAQLRMLSREKMDVFLLDRITSDNLSQYIKIKGLENYLHAIKTNVPVILYTAHFGRSIMPLISLGILGFKTYPLTVSAHGAKHEKWYLNKKISGIQRIMQGNFVHPDQSIRTLYQLLEQRKTIVIAFDVPPGAKQKHYEEVFLNGMIRCPKGIVKIAKKMQAILIPYFATEHEGHLSAEFLPAISSAGVDEKALFKLLLEPIEKKILNHPEQWWSWSWLRSFWREH